MYLYIGIFEYWYTQIYFTSLHEYSAITTSNSLFPEYIMHALNLNVFLCLLSLLVYPYSNYTGWKF